MKLIISALLLGRKGSKGFPGKNTKNVFGHPLAYYPMKAALNCPQVDNVYLSTDDEALIKLAKENGVQVIIRPQELCSDNVLGEHAFVHGYEEIKKINLCRDIELMVLLFCNAPMITPEMISSGIRILRENNDYDSAVTVSKYNMWSPLRARKVGEDDLLHPFVPFEALGTRETINCDRDCQGDVWFADMGVSIVRPRCLDNLNDGLPPQRWMGRKIYPLKQWGGLDVDYEWQIPQVEYWLKKHGFGEQGKK